MKNSDEFQSYGAAYWDTGKEDNIGYGEYRYDGRYAKTAKKMAEYYKLKKGDTVFELACGKGFLLVEFLKLGFQVAGVELSSYAAANAHPDVRPFIVNDDFYAAKLPMKAFDLVIAKDCLPHMPKNQIPEIVNKCMAISRAHVCFEIEVCRSPYECDMMYKWDITHITRESPAWWENLLKNSGYQGDYHFKLLVQDDALPNLDL